MARIGLRPGDSIQYGDLKLVVISGVVTFSASFSDGSKPWCEELLAGEYVVSKVKAGPKDERAVV
jgi:hypothetical protein